MASKQSNPRTSKAQSAQPKTPSPDTWHEDRYGEHRDKLSDEQLKQLVEDICGKNWDEESAAALVLLMDEIERAQFDRLEVAGIASTVSSAAFKYTSAHETAEKRLVAVMRRDVSRKEVVN